MKSRRVTTKDRLAEYAFAIQETALDPPAGMCSWQYVIGSQAVGGTITGRTESEYVVLSVDEQAKKSRMLQGAFWRRMTCTALYHVLTPSGIYDLNQVGTSQRMSIESLVLDDQSSGGLITRHEASIPEATGDPMADVGAYVSSMSGPTVFPRLSSPKDLVDLEWQKAEENDLERFLYVLNRLIANGSA